VARTGSAVSVAPTVSTTQAAGTGSRLLRLDPTRSLTAFFGVGGLLCWAAGLLPHDRVVDSRVVGVVGVVAVLVAAGLLAAGQRRPPPIPAAVLVVLVAAGSALIAVLVAAGRGTGEAVGFAAFIMWVAVYSACFFTLRIAAVQTILGVGGISAAWAAPTSTGCRCCWPPQRR